MSSALIPGQRLRLFNRLRLHRTGMPPFYRQETGFLGEAWLVGKGFLSAETTDEENEDLGTIFMARPVEHLRLYLLLFATRMENGKA